MFLQENKKAGDLAQIGRKGADTGTGRKTLEKKDNFQELGVDRKIILK